MKSLKRIVTLLLVLTVAAAAFVLPGAAASEDATANPGKTAQVSFTFENIAGIDGEYFFDNESIIEDVTVSYNKDLPGGDVNQETKKYYIYGSELKTITFTFTVKLSANAKAGDTCAVTMRYETSNVNGEMSDFQTVKKTIKVVAEEPKPTDPKPTDPKPTDPKPPVTVIDYTELLHQISIAEGLDEAKYTDASWANLVTALDAARALKTSKDQAAVDAGAQALKDAIAALKLMDYSKLLEAIEQVSKLIEDDELGAKWAELYSKMMAAKDLLTSGDQAAVDAAAEELNKLYQEMLQLIKDYIENNKEVIEVPVEVPVEKEPDGPFCNISIHKLWPILFAISAVLNLVLLAVIVVYLVRKKQNQKDETPLVDYDIDDDKV